MALNSSLVFVPQDDSFHVAQEAADFHEFLQNELGYDRWKELLAKFDAEQQAGHDKWMAEQNKQK